MINSLWYPPNSGSSDVRPWDANGSLTPRAHGDYDSNTATSYGLMLAYNQFSGNTALQASGMGGFGRKGAQRLVILETDGLANASTSASTTNAAPTRGISTLVRATAIRRAATDPNTDAINVANQICRCTTIRATVCLVSRPRPSRSRSSASLSGPFTSPPRRRPTTRRESHCCSRSRRSAARRSQFGERSDQRL